MPPSKKVLRDFKTGQQTNKQPFVINEDAFERLFNAYVWRGQVKKKSGTTKLGRLRRDLSTVSLGNSGASPWTINTIFTVASPQIGVGETNKDLVPALSSGPVITITIGAIVFTDQGNGTMTSPTPGNSGTINYATGEVVLTHTAGAGVATTANVSYYPGLPVMGLPSKTLLVLNEEELIAFDTKYAYKYNNATARFIQTPSANPVTTAVTWSGTNSQFFWTENAYQALFATNNTAGLQGYAVTAFAGAAAGPPSTVNVTTTLANSLSIGDEVIFINLTGAAAANNGLRGVVTVAGNPITISNPDGTVLFPLTWVNDAATTGTMIVSRQNLHGDGIRWYDDVSWINFNPVVNRVSALMGAAIIVFYRGRIVVLDTLEGNNLTPTATRYPQRARWSQNGSPFDIGPVPTGSNIGIDYRAWREDIPGKGGYNDCPTTEEITGACFLRDTLIVAFEHSIWKLRYTNNELLPFIWERIDLELGSEGRFSGVKFDKQVLFVGNRGIIGCNGVGVERIDMLIPEIAFNFNNVNSGPERIYGIRDFEEQLVYWTFPNDQAPTGVFPNRVLCYNYMDGSWGEFSDSFTCYGYWQAFDDLTWEDALRRWREYNVPWVGKSEDRLQAKVISGNQVGYVQIVQNQVPNDPTLKINSITPGSPGVATVLTIVSHNLASGDFIYLSGFQAPNDVLNGLVFQVQAITADTVGLYQYNFATGVYELSTLGSATYIGKGEASRVDNFNMLTKKFNPFLDEAISVKMGQIDFYVSATAAGRFAVNLYVNDANNTPANPPAEVDDTDPLANPLSNRVETFANPYEPQGQEKYWHSLYDNVTGNLFQIELTYGDQEMNTPSIYSSEVAVHSIAPQSTPGPMRMM